MSCVIIEWKSPEGRAVVPVCKVWRSKHPLPPPPPGTHHYENICVTSTLQLNNRTKTTQPVEHIYSKTRKCMQCAMEARSCNHLLQGKSNQCYIFWVCVCSLRYPVCNAHAPYCHLWPVRFYHIFPHYLITRFSEKKKKLLHIKCVFWVCLQLLSKTFLILRRTERDMIKNVQRSSCKVPVILVRF